jgi:hypothetical protein
MDIGRIVREIEVLPDTEEEPLPLAEPDRVTEPARPPERQPV